MAGTSFVYRTAPTFVKAEQYSSHLVGELSFVLTQTFAESPRPALYIVSRGSVYTSMLWTTAILLQQQLLMLLYLAALPRCSTSLRMSLPHHRLGQMVRLTSPGLEPGPGAYPTSRGCDVHGSGRAGYSSSRLMVKPVTSYIPIRYGLSTFRLYSCQQC
jgi:hypothetical protein